MISKKYWRQQYASAREFQSEERFPKSDMSTISIGSTANEVHTRMPCRIGYAEQSKDKFIYSFDVGSFISFTHLCGFDLVLPDGKIVSGT